MSKYSKILLLPGQQRPNPIIKALLAEIIGKRQAVLVTDVISNQSQDGSVIHHDFFIKDPDTQSGMAPDLIISFGKSILSKAMKLFLRNTQAAHWHIQPGAGRVPDPFQKLSHIIPVQPEYFLDHFSKEQGPANPIFIKKWTQKSEALRDSIPSLLEKQDFGELVALQQVLSKIPPFGKVHLANSLAVRNVNRIGIPEKDLEIICNRGTSGIDGSSSTAVGCTFTTKENVTLITGDMAFFYDRNAFWHQYQLTNLRVVLFNNHGGGIFRMIDGPAEQPELEEYFETQQKLNAKSLAAEMGFEYCLVRDAAALEDCLETFFQKSLRPKIVEIESSSENNTRTLKTLNESVKRFLIDRDL